MVIVSTGRRPPVAVPVTSSTRVPRSSVTRGTGVPAVLHVERLGADVELRAARHDPLLEAGGVRREDRDRVSVRVEHRLAGGREVVGAEDVAGGRLRVAAHVGGLEVLVAGFEAVAAGAVGRLVPGERAGHLPVVPIFRIRGVEVRRIVEAVRRHAGRDAARAERRPGERVSVPPFSRRPKRRCATCACANRLFESTPAVADHPEVVRRPAIDDRPRVDAEVLDRLARFARVVLEIAALDRVSHGRRARELHLPAVVAAVARDRHAGLGQREGRLLRLAAARAEEPEAVARDRAAEGALVVLLQVRGPGLTARDLEGRLGRPRWAVEVDAERAAEVVAAAAGDGVDRAAAEAAEIGRNAGPEDLHFLNGVFDEEEVRLAEDVVGDVDAVDRELVVVGEAAGNRELAIVGRVGAHAG
jgi:hypothetical protein